MNQPKAVSVDTAKRSFTVDVSDTIFPRCLFFNRFFLEKVEGGHVCAYFGFQVNGLVIDEAACLFSKDTIKNHKERNLPYLGKFSANVDDVPKWTPSRVKTGVEVVDIYNCSRLGSEGDSSAEISTYRLLMHNIAVPPKGSGKGVILKGQPVLLLRSDTGVQRKFLEQLHLIADDETRA